MATLPLPWNSSNLDIIFEAIARAPTSDAVVDVRLAPSPDDHRPTIVRVAVNSRARWGGKIISRWREGADNLEAEPAAGPTQTDDKVKL